ncbi:MAG: sulfatase/phosphatase domain-containing protein, partial [Lentisphaeria bacterium]
APTFLEIAGAKIPEAMQGGSMVNVFKDDKAKLRDEAYYHYYESPSEHRVPAHFALINKRYKLIRYYAFGKESMDQWELYDMVKDPREMTNVFEEKEYTKIRREMIEKLKEKREKFNNNIGNLGKFQ